jgi:hypothetical protein
MAAFKQKFFEGHANMKKHLKPFTVAVFSQKKEYKLSASKKNLAQ